MGKNKEKHIIKKSNPKSDWIFGDKLGEGTYGIVYLANHIITGSIAASKVCPVACDDEYIDLVQEAMILIECDHPNILKAFCVYHFDKTIFMFLEACMGGSLDFITHVLRGLNENVIRVILYQCLQGLTYLHKNCVIHRDIKGENIMLTEKGLIKISDFGVSARLESPDGRRLSFIGTPHWMAPEVIKCESDTRYPYNNKADVFSLGITAIELAEIDPPNHDLLPTQVTFYRLRYETSLTIPEKWSAPFQHIVSLMTEKEPLSRITSDQCLEGEETLKNELLLELYKIMTANTQQCEEVDITEQSYSFSDEEEKSENYVNSQKPIDRTALRTVKRTIRYEINGVSKELTVVKTIDESHMDLLDRERIERDKIQNQLKILLKDERRELNKQASFHQQSITDIILRHKTEYNNLINKYTSEAEILTKHIFKELEKKKAIFRFELEKLFKTVKVSLEKEKKIQKSAIKPKDELYLFKLCEKSCSSISQLEAIQNEQLVEFYQSLITLKNQKLLEILKSIISLRFFQVLEISQMRINHTCLRFDVKLQHTNKYNHKETQLTAKSLAERMDIKIKAQSQDRRTYPKQLRERHKKELESLKRELRKRKVKDLKEQIQAKQNKLSLQYDHELAQFTFQQENEIAVMDERHKQIIRDLQAYHNEKLRSLNHQYLEQIYHHYVEDEEIFKGEILSMYQIKLNRDAENQKEMSDATKVTVNCQLNLDILCQSINS